MLERVLALACLMWDNEAVMCVFMDCRDFSPSVCVCVFVCVCVCVVQMRGRALTQTDPISDAFTGEEPGSSNQQNILLVLFIVKFSRKNRVVGRGVTIGSATVTRSSGQTNGPLCASNI